MKRLLLIIIVLSTMVACKKTAVSPGLSGKWELRAKFGSIVGFDSTFQAGNGHVLQFKSDSTYLQFNKGQLVTQGKFHIRTTDYPQANSLSIFFDESSYDQYFNLADDKLQIGMDADDGIETVYQKISN